MRMISRIAFSAIVAVSFASAGKLAPNKTHAVLNVTYTNEENVPHAKKKLTFVGQNKGKKVVLFEDEELYQAVVVFQLLVILVELLLVLLVELLVLLVELLVLLVELLVILVDILLVLLVDMVPEMVELLVVLVVLVVEY